MDHPMASSPHVLMFPLPSLGDMSPMLKLAQLLGLANLKVTFINTIYNHNRLNKNGQLEQHFSRYRGFQFKVMPDGLPEDHPRAGGNWLPELIRGLKANSEQFLREVMAGPSQITCLIADGILSFALEVAEQAEVPVIEFRAFSACFFWVYYCLPQLIDAGEIPFGDDDRDRLIQNVPGMSDFLRRRDLPDFFQIKDNSKLDFLQLMVKRIQARKPQSILLNTFEDLEGPYLSRLQAHHHPNIYSVGPLHAHLKYKLSQAEIMESSSSTCFWEVDRNCMSWLDQKPDKSVVFVSFGSLTLLKRNQLLEIWAGLVESEKYFLWVVRPDMITETDTDSPTPAELLQGAKERGLMVSWAAQEEILTHQAVGGFLTHSGWNSALESITAGVPMLCWPYFFDQLLNSRLVSEVWRIGLDMKDTCDRSIVAKMVRDLMEERRDELERTAKEMSNLAKKSVSEGGSSYRNLNRLIEDIRLMSKTD